MIFPGPLVPGWWKAVSSVPRLRLSGTGTIAIDVRDRDGTITPVFSARSPQRGQIAWPLGDDTVAARAVTGNAIAEIL
jgi:hypothetical protein